MTPAMPAGNPTFVRSRGRVPFIIGGMQAVSVREVRALLDIAAGIEYDPPSGFAPEALIALCELLEADWVTYCERPRGPITGFSVSVEVGRRPYFGHRDGLDEILYANHDEFTLGLTPAPDGGVLLNADVTTERAWRKTALYNEWCREAHIEPQAKAVLAPFGSPVLRALMIDLADDARRSFGHRERTLLKLIQPAFARPIALAEATRERHRALGLTPRELEVLGFVRDGMSNGEIAAKLFVSRGTIRTHLENAFAKLGAHSRTGAIARLGEIARPSQSAP
jgi:DNA-binding CsgD family transcriptional regulator